MQRSKRSLFSCPGALGCFSNYAVRTSPLAFCSSFASRPSGMNRYSLARSVRRSNCKTTTLAKAQAETDARAETEAGAGANVTQSQEIGRSQAPFAAQVLAGGSIGRGIIFAMASNTPSPPPNPSIERTHNGSPLQAFISFWALRSLPLCAAHVTR